MDADDAARIAHYRRCGRPDWRRFVRPDWERYVHPAGHAAMRKEFALLDRAFETPLAKRLREENETREREELERLEAKHQAEIEREALAIRADIAAPRVELMWLAICRSAKFNPNQPRVPAGDPDGGQWTSGDEAQGTQIAQNETQRAYSVDLSEEEARGGHTLRDHVGKTDNELLANVRADRGSAGIFRYARQRQGSFESPEAANDFVNRTLERNRALVDRVADGKSDEAFLKDRFGYRTGREAFRPNIDSEPYLRDTYEVGVLIRHDPGLARGYRVHTGYPMNEAPR